MKTIVNFLWALRFVSLVIPEATHAVRDLTDKVLLSSSRKQLSSRGCESSCSRNIEKHCKTFSDQRGDVYWGLLRASELKCGACDFVDRDSASYSATLLCKSQCESACSSNIKNHCTTFSDRNGNVYWGIKTASKLKCGACDFVDQRSGVCKSQCKSSCSRNIKNHCATFSDRNGNGYWGIKTESELKCGACDFVDQRSGVCKSQCESSCRRNIKQHCKTFSDERGEVYWYIKLTSELKCGACDFVDKGSGKCMP